jgi:hypothetical protein
MNNKINTIDEKLMKAWGFIASTLAGGIISYIFFSGKLTSIFSGNFYNNIGHSVNKSSFFLLILFLAGCISIIQTAYIIIKSFKAYKALKATFLTVSILIQICAVHSVLSQHTSVMLANTIARNTEIIHPYITDTEYIKLKSDLLQIDSKQDFDKVDNTIRNVAKKFNANID